MRRSVIVAGITAVLAAAMSAGAATNSVTKLHAQLRGSNERPAAPASNRGKVELRVNGATGKICWKFEISKIDGPPTQAHIHKGARGVSGNVFVALGGAQVGYARQGCTLAGRAKAKAILRKPAGFYVNVHNSKHPRGAMRGQLVRGA